jgi:WD40 repeat protein
MNGDAPAAEGPDGPRVFVSYSRKDLKFAEALTAALTRCGFRAFYDRAGAQFGIAFNENWWDRITRLIAASDVVVFIVSPKSISSKVCGDEIGYAQSLNKALIPISWRRTNLKKAPTHLQAINIGFSFEGFVNPDEAPDFKALVSAIEIDINWTRRTTDYLSQAIRWRDGGKATGELIRPEAIETVRAHLAARPTKALRPPEVLFEYLAASDAKAQSDRDELRSTIAQAFIRPLEEELEKGKFDAALRQLAAGAILARDLQFELEPELWRTGAIALAQNRCRVALHHEHPAHLIKPAPSGKHVLTFCDQDGVAGVRNMVTTATIWDITSGAEVARLKDIHHTASVTAFALEGAQLVTAGEGAIEVWWTHSGERVSNVEFDDSTSSIDISPNALTVAAATANGPIRLWTREDAHTPFSEAPPIVFEIDAVSQVRLSPNGASLLVGFETGEIKLIDVKSLIARTFRGQVDSVSSLEFAENGKLAASTGISYTDALVWDLERRTRAGTLHGHERGISILRLSADGETIVTLDHANTARVFDTFSGAASGTISDNADAICAIAISADGQRIVTGHRSGLVQVRRRNGDPILRLAGHDGAIMHVGFDKMGRVLTSGVDKVARVSTIAADEIARIETPGAISSDGRWVLRPGQIDGFEIAETTSVRNGVRVEHKISAAQFSYDSRSLVFVDDTGGAFIWRRGENQADAWRQEHAWQAPDKRVQWMRLSDNAERILIHSGKTLQIIDQERNSNTSHDADTRVDAEHFNTALTKQLLRAPNDQPELIVLDLIEQTQVVCPIDTTFDDHSYNEDNWARAAFSSDGKRVAAAYTSGCVRIWDALTGEHVATGSCFNDSAIAIHSIAFSEDGDKLIVSRDDRTANVFCAKTGSRLEEFAVQDRWIADSCISPDSALAATAGGDGVARIWDLARGAELARFVHADSVTDVRFSTDGGRLFTRDLVAAWRVWDIRGLSLVASSPIAAITASLGRGVGVLTENEHRQRLLRKAGNDLGAALSTSLNEDDRLTLLHYRP